MLTFFTPFDVKMIQISTFPAAPSTERVPSLAERVASLRCSINLQLLNNRVPGLLLTLHDHYLERDECMDKNQVQFFYVVFIDGESLTEHLNQRSPC